MIKGEEIKRLVGLLETRSVLLYHACQLEDFRSYLALGGVPSRAVLESSRRVFTSFETDQSDRESGVWDKVFVNLSDFGRTFADGHAATPNPYGPILLALRPGALLASEDVAICLRSAGGRDFDREGESLRSISDVNRLFKFPTGEPGRRSAWIKFSNELRRGFGDNDAHDPEVSVTIEGGILETEHVAWAVADPYEFNGKSLHQIVMEERARRGLRFAVYERWCKDERRRPLYNEIAAISTKGIIPLGRFLAGESYSEGLKAWARQLRGRNLDYQYKRFVDYLRKGTLAPLGV